MAFTVAFNRIARTLVYEDEVGRILFAFDVSPSGELTEKWFLHLGAQPLTEDGMVMSSLSEGDRDRVALALQRTREHVRSCGYKVVDEK